MDDATACDHTVTHNDDMEEGDFYTLSSDRLQGHLAKQHFPAECSEAFDFGDRLASVQIMSWYCSDKIVGNPVLTIYHDCTASRRNQMVRVTLYQIYDISCFSSSPTDDIQLQFDGSKEPLDQQHIVMFDLLSLQRGHYEGLLF